MELDPRRIFDGPHTMHTIKKCIQIEESRWKRSF
jgi:hypothetical protein